MPASINRVAQVGNLTRDPELKHAKSGTAVCEFSVAVNGREKVDGEWVDRADFFDVTVFGNQAEACAQYLQKGSQVAVDGRLRQNRWENDEGQKRSRVVIIADAVQFLARTVGSDDRGTSAGGDFGGDVDF
jgi:single-strand DNA-binding protein